MADHFTMVLNKLDEAFSVQETRNYALFIQFNESNFIYCIFDYKRNKFMGVQQLRRNEFSNKPGVKATFNDFLKSILNTMPWLKNPYKTVKIAYEGKKNTLIPGPLFDANEMEQYLRLNFMPEPEEKIQSDHIVLLDNFNVFSIPGTALDAVSAVYPHTRISHLSTILIESIVINYKNRINTNRVFLHVREKHFDIMLFDGRQMSYFNSFPYLNAEDVTYYLIFVVEQLGINPENIPVVLLGKADRSSNLFELLQRYIRHVEFGRRNDNFKYSHVFSHIPSQSFYPLINFIACGS
ncbi:MAG: DUF3822 family protein [bacterium]